MDVRVKRAYEQAADSDGYRVLIDRLWPRGVSKADARLDEWARELARATSRDGGSATTRRASMHNDAVVLAEILRG